MEFTFSLSLILKPLRAELAVAYRHSPLVDVSCFSPESE